VTKPPPDETATTRTAQPPNAGHPDRIGPYRILQKIGEGGMGIVYEAEQETPVRRRVALKLVKWGMDTGQVVARFEAERQALALMNHPNVARVFDAGATREGRPYFVMECVKGVPITEHCDRHRLTTRERLELFMQVCEGVQHAHQKGIIHRDIKPSNILVEVREGKAVPKIIDFGVAKATEHRLTERTLFTELGQLVGTPEYMSPEQAEMTHQDIDTRTDVYSLGVVLYELLVGALPFDPKTLREAGYDEIRRRIREEDPPKPSTRISTLESSKKTKCAARRRTDPQALSRSLRGDLDWIAIRALEKDRTRRYPTAMGLAVDIERHLKHEPVRASPPSVAYRIRKFMARHRVGVAAGVMVALALIVGAALAVGGMVNAREQRDVARREAMKAEAINAFLLNTFALPDPLRGAGRDVTVLEAMDRSTDKITSMLGDQPEVEAAVKNRLGDVYRRLGEYQAAEALLVSALELRLELFDRDHPDVAETLFLLASARHDLGQLEEAEQGYLESLEIVRRLLGDENSDVARGINTVARLRRDQGDLEQSEALFREALAMRRNLLGPNDADVAESTHDLAQLLQMRGKYDEAEQLFRESLRISTELHGPEHPEVAFARNGLATMLYRQGRYDESEALFREVLTIQRRTLGEGHEQVAAGLLWIGYVLQAKQEYDEAETVIREALEIYREAVGEDHHDVGTAFHNLAVVLREKGDLEGALSLFERAWAIRENALRPNHYLTATTRGSMGACLARLGRYEEAEQHLKLSLQVNLKEFGSDHGSTRWTASALVDLYRAWGKPDEAEKYVRLQ
jgi:serine/threonine protein kinase/tetratricopeptide (TPR) repeat protein